jgi:predicted XRE-type DNA-binding protein
MVSKKLKAVVISGDVIASSRLKPLQRKKLQTQLDKFAQAYSKLYPDLQFQQYRGDSLQATLSKNRIHALSMAVQLQSFLMMEEFKIRLALGIGEISFQSKDVITSDGSAFQLSGPLVDEIKRKNELIAVTATNNEFAAEWRVHSESLNFLLQRLSAAQAEALYHLLQNKKQEEIAKTLKITQPSVHQRLQAAGAQVFTSIIQRFESTVPLL